MDATRDGSCFIMGIEEAFHFLHDRFKATRLISGRRGDRIAVHGIGNPGDGATVSLRSAQQRRKIFKNRTCTHASDECQTSFFPFGIQSIHQSKQIVGGRCRTNLDADRVTHTCKKLNMSTFKITCSPTHKK